MYLHSEQAFTPFLQVWHHCSQKRILLTYHVELSLVFNDGTVKTSGLTARTMTVDRAKKVDLIKMYSYADAFSVI